MSNVISESTPKARKDHKCDWCLQAIQKGEVYSRANGVSDGSLFTWKAHLKCLDIVNKLPMEDWSGDGITSDMFREEVDEKFDSLQHELGTPPFVGNFNITERINYILARI